MTTKNSSHSDSSPEGAKPEAFSSEIPNPDSKKRIVRIPIWMRTIPFFLSSTLFLSGFFAWLAPFPLLLFRMRAPLWMGLLALATNAVLVRFLGGPASLSIYLGVVGIMVLAIPELLRRRIGPGVTGFSVWMLVAFFAVLALVADASLHQSSLAKQWNAQVDSMVQTVVNEVPSESRQEWFGVSDAEEIKAVIKRELPSGFLVVVLAMVWANLTLLLNANPFAVRQSLGLGRDYFRSFKISEYWVWPTILFGAGWLLVPETFMGGWVNAVSVNGFRVMMALYLIQGISILSFFFDIWKVRGLMRFLAFGAVFAFLMPVTVAAGFFDLWFDFRSKLRQS